MSKLIANYLKTNQSTQILEPLLNVAIKHRMVTAKMPVFIIPCEILPEVSCIGI
jgi:hypothetical protein